MIIVLSDKIYYTPYFGPQVDPVFPEQIPVKFVVPDDGLLEYYLSLYPKASYINLSSRQSYIKGREQVFPELTKKRILFYLNYQSYGPLKFQESKEKIKVLALCVGPLLSLSGKESKDIDLNSLAQLYSGIPVEYLMKPSHKQSMIDTFEYLKEKREPQLTVLDPSYPFSYGEMISDIIGSDEIKDFVSERKNFYDYIICDGCPFLSNGTQLTFEGISQLVSVLKKGGKLIFSARSVIKPNVMVRLNDDVMKLQEICEHVELIYKDNIYIRI